jgi:hypothetical protein
MCARFVLGGENREDVGEVEGPCLERDHEAACEAERGEAADGAQGCVPQDAAARPAARVARRPRDVQAECAALEGSAEGRRDRRAVQPHAEHVDEEVVGGEVEDVGDRGDDEHGRQDVLVLEVLGEHKKDDVGEHPWEEPVHEAGRGRDEERVHVQREHDGLCGTRVRGVAERCGGGRRVGTPRRR